MTDRTKEVIAGMLKENTGTHFLDSGGQSGRHWQRNQAREFDKEPRGKLHFYSGVRFDGEHYGGFDASMNLYHWLNDHVSFSEMMDTLFHDVYVPLCPEDENWFELSHKFGDFLGLRGAWKDRKQEILDLMLSKPEWRELWGQDSWEWKSSVREEQTWEVSLPMGEKVDEFYTEYTYNFDNYLDQDIHYDIFSWDSTEYVILMVHGGCDARGGFTRPRIFETNGDGFGGFADCYISCQNGHAWETMYDGYHFKPADIDKMEPGPSLDEYEILDEEDYEQRLKEQQEAFGLEYQAAINYKAQMDAGQTGFENMPMPDAPNFEPQMENVIKHDKDGNGFCPICGTKLELDFFPE